MFFSTCFTVICRDVQSGSASKVSRCKVLCIVLHLLLHSPHFLRICWWTSFVSLCSFHRVFLTFHVFFWELDDVSTFSWEWKRERGDFIVLPQDTRHRLFTMNEEEKGKKETSYLTFCSKIYFPIVLFIFTLTFNLLGFRGFGKKMARCLWQEELTSQLRPFVSPNCLPGKIMDVLLFLFQ